jgi:hypothetical protein
MKILLLVVLTVFQLSIVSHAETTEVKNVTMQNTLFNQLIGNWEIQDWSLDEKGNWQPSQGADWNWYKILDGNAIQDDWISPSMDVKTEKRQFGTNIRIYNPKKSQWEMAWMASTGQKLDTFTAIEDSKKVVMSGFYAGANSKITFFNIKENSFDWKLELEQADKSWLEVYRIKGSKK